MRYQAHSPASRRFARLRTALTLPFLCLFVPSCGPGDSDYFPLTPDWSWAYRVTSDIRNISKTTSHMLVTNGKPITVDGQHTTPRMYQDGHVFYYASEDDGILLIADRPAWKQAAPAQPEQWVLKYPLTVGASWPVQSKTHLLRRQLFGPTAVASVPVVSPIDITYTVEALDAAVRVPAGTYHNCLRLKGEGKGVVNMGERIGEVDVTIETTQWFAPGIGLVKIERKEDTGPESSAAGSMTVELDAIDKGSWFH